MSQIQKVNPSRSGIGGIEKERKELAQQKSWRTERLEKMAKSDRLLSRSSFFAWVNNLFFNILSFLIFPLGNSFGGKRAGKPRRLEA